MFKGLRAKIENEQKCSRNSNARSSLQLVPKDIVKSSSSNSINQETTSTDQNVINGDQEPNVVINNNAIPENTDRTNSTLVTNTSLTDISELTPENFIDSSNQFYSKSSQRNNELLVEITDLKNELARIHDQLRSVIKERDEGNDENAQLYQLIEKLRKSLDGEKETNAVLKDKLDKTLKENNELVGIGEYKNKANISMKSCDATHSALSNGMETTEDEVQNLVNLKRINSQLETQLSEKNRQLKIKQQNLNDMKKSLQKEILEHSKTREELISTQNQLKKLQQVPQL